MNKKMKSKWQIIRDWTEYNLTHSSCRKNELVAVCDTEKEADAIILREKEADKRRNQFFTEYKKLKMKKQVGK